MSLRVIAVFYMISIASLLIITMNHTSNHMLLWVKMLSGGEKGL